MPDVDVPRHWFQFSLRALLLLFIPVALLTALATWLFRPPPIDVAMIVKGFSWYGDGAGHRGLGAEVCIVNRSKHTVWYLEYPRYYLLQLVDGKWTESLTGTKLPAISGKAEQDWWSPQNGMQTTNILVGPISEKATAMKVAIPFTTDRFMPKSHLVFTPVVQIVKKGRNYFPKVEEGADIPQSLDAHVNEGHLPSSNGGQGK